MCLQQDLVDFLGEGNVPENADSDLLKKMYQAKNTRLFGKTRFGRDAHVFRSNKTLREEEQHVVPDGNWYDGVVPMIQKTRKYKYRGQGGLRPQQEWLLFLSKIHHNVPNSFLAERWLPCPCEDCCRSVRNIIHLWTAAMYHVLRSENFWVDPDVLEEVNVRLAKEDNDIPALYRSDCSCTPMQGHKGGEKGRSLEASNGLWGHYYHTHGAKWCLIIGPNGGILGVSTTFGAGTSDRQIMHHMNIFDRKAYKRNSCTCSDNSCSRCQKPIPFYYDCAAMSMTSDFVEVGLDPILSGQKRKSKTQSLPYEVKGRTQTFSKKRRIRVECVIGILKRRFPVLSDTLPQWWAPQVDKVVYVCCMLSNFCHSTITRRTLLEMVEEYFFLIEYMCV